MINQNFLWSITINGQPYTLSPRDQLPSTGKYIVKKGDRIPYLLCFTKEKEIRIPSMYNNFQKTMDLDTVIRVFLEGNQLIFVPVRYRHYYVGKGVIMDSFFNILAMITVTEQYYNHYKNEEGLTVDHILEHFTLVVNTAFESTADHKSLYTRFRKLYKAQSFNIHFTRHPERETFVNTTFPCFESLEQRQEFTTDLTFSYFEELLTS
ncbi:hypothetical protein HGH93_23530 [Chitinophaga polysaccharea]|uniref:hypothetical protein n=1 Tax=Chitinophaga polysaccharea TaxID=1293035 RepID=UPI001455BE48|nr:hypothetical protein [Chitinophaga polysaccharea]NLR61093.1 hypothetical protein [Chitinophaga polysaccharea]